MVVVVVVVVAEIIIAIVFVARVALRRRRVRTHETEDARLRACQNPKQNLNPSSYINNIKRH